MNFLQQIVLYQILGEGVLYLLREIEGLTQTHSRKQAVPLHLCNQEFVV